MRKYLPVAAYVIVALLVIELVDRVFQPELGTVLLFTAAWTVLTAIVLYFFFRSAGRVK